MKTKLLIAFVLLAHIGFALNLEMNLYQTKSVVYDNESLIMKLNVTNNEIQFSAVNSTLVLSYNNGNRTMGLGDIGAGANLQKDIDLGILSAGTYPITAYLEYSWLDMRLSSGVFQTSATITPSQTIVMREYEILIGNITTSANIEAWKEFSITIQGKSAITNGELTYKLDDVDLGSDAIQGGGPFSFTKSITVYSSGTHTFEVTAYEKTGDSRLLKEHKAINFIAINKSEYKTIENTPIEKKTGEVRITASSDPIGNFINGVSCFATGCKTDFQAPILRDFHTNESDEGIMITFTADDTTTGNSSIISCSASVESGQETLSTVNGYNQPIVELAYNLPSLTSSTTVTFTCYDEFGNSVSNQVSIKPKAPARLVLSVEDAVTNKAIPDAVIYVNDKAKVTTKADGTASLTLFSDTYKINIDARGYEAHKFTQTLNEGDEIKKTVSLSQALEARFDVPAGFEEFTQATKAAHTAIHPQEKNLMQYSFPLYSTNKIDVSKDLMTVVDKYVEYDFSCLENPKPVTCQAWLDSDYDVIRTHSGVCYDWATLGTSFSDSYGIPARYVNGWWESVDITGKRTTAGHAWQEVYLPELGGWVHLDTLWNAFNDPCVYSKHASCVEFACYYDPATGQCINADDRYICGKPCYTQNEALATEKPSVAFSSEYGSGFDYYYNVYMQPQNLTLVYGRSLTAQEKGDVYAEANNGSLNMSFVESYLLDNLNLSKYANYNVIDTRFKNNYSAVEVELRLSSVSVNEYTDAVVLSQFDTLVYTVKSSLLISSASPLKELTLTDTTAIWNFTTPGQKNIRVDIAKMGITVFSLESDVVTKNLVRYDADILGFKNVLLKDGEIPPTSTLSQGNVALILGLNTEISSSLDSDLEKKGNSVIRVSGQSADRIASLVRTSNSHFDKVFVADSNDLDSINEAISEAKQVGSPVLITSMSALETGTMDALKQIKPSNIIMVSGENKPSSELTRALEAFAPVTQKNVKTQDNTISLEVGQTKTSTAAHGFEMNWLLVIAVVLGFIIMVGGLMFYIKKKRG